LRKGKRRDGDGDGGVCGGFLGGVVANGMRVRGDEMVW